MSSSKIIREAAIETEAKAWQAPEVPLWETPERLSSISVDGIGTGEG